MSVKAVMVGGTLARLAVAPAMKPARCVMLADWIMVKPAPLAVAAITMCARIAAVPEQQRIVLNAVALSSVLPAAERESNN